MTTTTTQKRHPIRIRVNERTRNLVELVQRHGFSTDDAHALQSIARSLHHASERSCNEDMTDAQQARHEKRADRLEREAAEIAAGYGWRLYIQGDPRGWPLYLWRQDDLDAYNARGSRSQYDIDAVYNAIGYAVCPSR